MPTQKLFDISRIRENCRRDRIRVLMYHRVVNQSSSDSLWSVKATLFRSHLELLQRAGFSTITLSEYAAALENNQALPPKPVILTFDDGYLDFFEVALPILQDYGMKGVVFAVADPTSRTNFWDAGTPHEDAPLMEDHHLVKVHRAGCEVGSHALTHPSLPELSESEIWHEVYKSRLRLEEIIEAPVSSFCYPYGALNDTCKRLVIQAGYKSACAASTGPARFTKDQYEIRRIQISHDLTPTGLWMRLALPYQEYRWIVWKAQSALT